MSYFEMFKFLWNIQYTYLFDLSPSKKGFREKNSHCFWISWYFYTMLHTFSFVVSVNINELSIRRKELPPLVNIQWQVIQLKPLLKQNQCLKRAHWRSMEACRPSNGACVLQSAPFHATRRIYWNRNFSIFGQVFQDELSRSVKCTNCTNPFIIIISYVVQLYTTYSQNLYLQLTYFTANISWNGEFFLRTKANILSRRKGIIFKSHICRWLKVLRIMGKAVFDSQWNANPFRCTNFKPSLLLMKYESSFKSIFLEMKYLNSGSWVDLTREFKTSYYNR